MKKNLLRFAVLFMAGAMTALSCNPDVDPKDNPGNDPGGNTDDPKDEVSIVIDGNFADWDKVTAATADAVVGEPGTDLKKVKVVKATSDDTYIYFYTEISVDVIQHSESAHTGGNSNDGHGDETPAPFYVYLDADSKAETGFYPHLNGDTKKPYVEGLGLEMGFELYLFISTKEPEKGAQLGWSQIVIAPTKDGEGNPYDSDGDYYQQSDWWSLKAPEGGWDPELDNLAPSFENVASVLSGGVAKIEFAVQKDVLPIEVGSEIAFGCAMANGGEKASWGKYTGVVGPMKLKLK